MDKEKIEERLEKIEKLIQQNRSELASMREQIINQLDMLHSLVVAIETGDVNLKKRGFFG